MCGVGLLVAGGGRGGLPLHPNMHLTVARAAAARRRRAPKCSARKQIRVY